MTDEFDKTDKHSEIDEFLDKFDSISNVFDRSLNRMEQHSNEQEKEHTQKSSGSSPETPPEQPPELKINKTRMERLSESKPQNIFTTKLGPPKKDETSLGAAGDKNDGSTQAHNGEPMVKQHKKKKKYNVNKKKLFKFISLLFLGIILILGGIVISIIMKTPAIEPDNIYSLLSENCTLYDDEGNIVDSLLTSNKEMRTNVSYSDLPQDLIDAFVAIEDKTFWEHNGFNVVRIFGAIKESLFEGDRISGTSTITQQLARNLYLAETMSDRSMTRKITEAYYTVLLERHLSKKQILEAYLNTISLGYGTNGVQAASQAYFSKDVQDLALTECATLASLPKAPGTLAPVKRYESEEVADDDPNVISKGETYTLVYNDACIDRMHLVLSSMLAQERITQEEYDSAMTADLRESIHPSQDITNEISSYFADYVIEQVVEDLMKELKLDETQAKQMIYNNGLKIYTTMNSGMQKIAEEEVANNSNFPKVTGLSKDSAGNILNANKNILLYSYNNYFNEEGTFTLSSDEYQTVDDGGIKLLKGKHLTFPKTQVQGQIDYNVEFKDMYIEEDGIFYCIKGGVINIPQQYKSRDEDGNLVISGQFFTDLPDFFRFVEDGIELDNKTYMNNNTHMNVKTYTLRQKVIQPQSSMVIFDYKTGGIKAMVGGRNIEGRLLFNRAINPRQPGSSIKPMAVYAPALQNGLEKAESGIVNGPSEGNSYGQLWTAASVIDDAPLTIQGKLWPKNWYSGYRGLHTMRRSLEQSVNVNAVKIFTDIGIQNSLNFLKKCGITTVVESGSINDMNAAALALGGMSKGVSPLEMVAGYSSFANQGNYTKPIAYTKVTNKQGEIILEKAAEETRIMDAGVAFIMQDMLRSVVTSGIGSSASIGSQPVAGKTGTTSDNYDAWFVGFTPQYAASLWIGNDVNVELSQGSVSAAKLWSKIMKRVHEGIAPGSFPSAPSDVISVAIDTMSGRLPSELSALDPRGTVRNEYFIKGTEPTTTDNVHVSVDICSDSGYLATPYCPNVVSKVFVKRPYTADPNVADIDFEQPSYYCNLHNPNAALYPIDPNTTLSPGSDIWDGSSGNPDGGGIIPIDPGNGNGDNDGDGSQDDGSEPPDWLDFFD